MKVRILFCASMYLLVTGAGALAGQQEPTAFQISRFAERYLDREITLRNTWWYPTLRPVTDRRTGVEYFGLYPNASQHGDLDFQSLGALGKVRGVVPAGIASQLAEHGIGGYEMHYFGTLTGRVVRVQTFGVDYFFVITRIVHHTPDGQVIRTYQ